MALAVPVRKRITRAVIIINNRSCFMYSVIDILITSLCSRNITIYAEPVKGEEVPYKKFILKISYCLVRPVDIQKPLQA